jgi:hypothetical protein
MLACLFSVAGLLSFDRHRDDPGWRRHLPWAWFVLALFTKQNAVAAPAAVFAALAADPGRRGRLPQALASFLVPLAILFGALVLTTGGEAWRHLFRYTAAAEYSWPDLVRAYRTLFLVGGPLLALVALALVSEWRALSRGPNLVLLVYWLLNAAALATSSKSGAAQNYLIEPYVATLLLAAASLAALREASPRVFRAWPAFFLMAAATATVVGHEQARLPQAIRNPDKAADFVALNRLVATTRGPILSENLSVLVLNRKPVLVEPFALVWFAEEALWDPAPLVSDCRRGFFDLVISEHRLQAIPGMGPCLEERYERVEILGPYEVMRPRG